MPSRRSRGALIAVTYAAVGPGVVYSYALYPISLLTFCTAVFLFALGRGRFALGGVAAGVAALAYPLGIVAAPAGAAWLLANRHLRLEARIRAAALVVFPTVAAALVFIGDQRLETGRWNAYFLVQRKYGHHLRDPFAAVAGADRALRHGRLLQGYHAIAIQTLLVTFVLLCVLVELVLRRGPTARFDALVALWAASTWCVALGQTNVSIWRGEAALLPMAILVRRLPTSLAAAITAAAFVVMLEMTHLYLLNLLI
jgi:hypothetical protein